MASAVTKISSPGATLKSESAASFPTMAEKAEGGRLELPFSIVAELKRRAIDNEVEGSVSLLSGVGLVRNYFITRLFE